MKSLVILEQNYIELSRTLMRRAVLQAREIILDLAASPDSAKLQPEADLRIYVYVGGGAGSIGVSWPRNPPIGA